MFGYLLPNRSELKVRELERYESWYCGLCQSLKDDHGARGRLSLSYDMTFLAILLGSLYEDRVRPQTFVCPAHPLQRRTMRRTPCSSYCADMNLMLAYYDYLDNWKDQKDPAALLQAKALQKDAQALAEKYPRQGQALQRYLQDLSACEREETADLERAAFLTGNLLAQIFDMKGGLWAEQLQTMGFFLGKFIYLSDAYEDVEEDIHRGNYNPFRQICRDQDFDEKVKSMLLMQIAPCCQAFEILPLVRDAGILRNILYSGVWTGYVRTYRKRKGLDTGSQERQRLVKR